MRQNGGSVDVIGPDDALDGYDLILLPSLLHVSDDLINRLTASNAQILAGPRTAIKTQDFQLPSDLTSDGVASLTGFQTQRIDALPAHMPIQAHYQETAGQVSIWREEGHVTGTVMATCDDGLPLLTKGNQGGYLCAWPDEGLLRQIIGDAMRQADLRCHEMPPYLRVRQRGKHLIFTHYGPEDVVIPDSFTGKIILGARQMSQADVTIMEIA